MTGATSSAAARFAGSETSESVPKAAAATGALPIVAAAVRANGSLTSGGAPRDSNSERRGEASSPIAATAAKLSCQPTCSEANGSIASVTTAASSNAYQRELGRDASAATNPAAPITPAR